MAAHYDLQEQEQLDQLKHFWNRWGTLISAVIIVICLAVAGWRGWEYWQAKQGAQAGALYEEVERAAEARDLARVERAYTDVKANYGGTAYAQQAALLAAKALYEGGQADKAQAALQWVAGEGKDPGYKAMARLRLAGIQIGNKAYDEALKTLSGEFPLDFQALAADRQGDALNLQGKANEAIEAYRKAYRLLGEGSDYRRLVEVKLAALGADPLGNAGVAPATAAPAKSASGA
jgi:predicted negative regulator of RcsB-dependent stress response